MEPNGTLKLVKKLNASSVNPYRVSCVVLNEFAAVKVCDNDDGNDCV